MNSELTKLNALTIINLATCLMELIAIPNKETLTVACALNCAWFSRYPRTMEVSLLELSSKKCCNHTESN